MKQLEFLLLRYVPDAVKGEFVNIGLVLLDSGRAAGLSGPTSGATHAHTDDRTQHVRFTRDWSRVRCLDPNADLEMLEAIEAELRREVADPSGRAIMLKRLQEHFSNVLEVTPPKACLAEDAASEADHLASLYLETALAARSGTRGRVMGARRRLFTRMREAFEQHGVWASMQQSVAVSAYTGDGDPLKLDCGYGINGDRPKAVKLFHAIAAEGDPDSAKVLAYSFPRLAAAIRRRDDADAELTAIVESLEPEDERAQFALETMRTNHIQVRAAAELEVVAAQARRDLRI